MSPWCVNRPRERWQGHRLCAASTQQAPETTRSPVSAFVSCSEFGPPGTQKSPKKDGGTRAKGQKRGKANAHHWSRKEATRADGHKGRPEAPGPDVRWGAPLGGLSGFAGRPGPEGRLGRRGAPWARGPRPICTKSSRRSQLPLRDGPPPARGAGPGVGTSAPPRADAASPPAAAQPRPHPRLTSTARPPPLPSSHRPSRPLPRFAARGVGFGDEISPRPRPQRPGLARSPRSRDAGRGRGGLWPARRGAAPGRVPAAMAALRSLLPCVPGLLRPRHGCAALRTFAAGERGAQGRGLGAGAPLGGRTRDPRPALQCPPRGALGPERQELPCVSLADSAAFTGRSGLTGLWSWSCSLCPAAPPVQACPCPPLVPRSADASALP